MQNNTTRRMSETFRQALGTISQQPFQSPYSNLVIHTPHAGTILPIYFLVPRHGEAIRRNNFKKEFIRPFYEQLTDHYTDKLFSAVVVGPYTKLGERIKQISFLYSRLFCDVERLLDDPLEEKGLGIHYDFEKITGQNYNMEWRYDKSFAIELYNEHQGKLFTAIESAQRYKFGIPLILDCHSFSKRDNILCPNAHEYKDIDICIGFNEDDTKPAKEFIDYVKNFFTSRRYRVEYNMPFSNSKTIQHCDCEAFKYADRDYVNILNYHSLMIEVNKHCYMNEDTLEITDGYYTLHQELQELYRNLLNV